MKRIFLTVIAIALASNVFGQRFCGSQLDFEDMQKSNPKRYQLFIDWEKQLQKQISSKSIPT